METKEIAKIGMIAAVYCVFTWAISPIAYGPIQFRLSEIMKPLALKGRVYIAGLSLGLLLANLISPFGGPWEWFWMPAMCWVGGEISYLMRKTPILSMFFYAGWISFAVSIMLQFLIGIPWYYNFGWIFIPELILMQVGLPIINKVVK